MKNCQRDLYEGLNLTQLEYAKRYGLTKDDLQYETYKIQLSCMKRLTVIACCRPHARDIYPDVISVNYP